MSADDATMKRLARAAGVWPSERKISAPAGKEDQAIEPPRKKPWPVATKPGDRAE